MHLRGKCLGKIQKCTKLFLFRQEKKLQKFGKDGNERVVTTFYKIKFIVNARFITSSLSNLVINLTRNSQN